MSRFSNLSPLHVLGLIGGLFLLTVPYTVPFITSDFWVNVIAEILIWGLFAASVNLLFGYTGLLSFGQALYFGVGAYGVTLAVDMYGLTFWPSFLIGIFVATFTAAVTGIFAARLTWHYFAIITIVFSLIFFFIAVGWKDVTGGDDGRPFSVPLVFKSESLELSLLDQTFQYYFILFIVGTCHWLMYRLLKSPLGYAFIAIRENASRASLVGYSAYKVRFISFVISGTMAGIAGVLYALFTRYSSAQYLFWTVSGDGLIWTIVGGTGTLFGPLLGTAFLIIIREELSGYWEHYLLIIGAIVIFMVIYAPDGMMGYLKKVLGRFGKEKATGVLDEVGDHPPKSHEESAS